MPKSHHVLDRKHDPPAVIDGDRGYGAVFEAAVDEDQRRAPLGQGDQQLTIEPCARRDESADLPAARITRSAVSGLTSARVSTFSARETVPGCTFATRATSRIVTAVRPRAMASFGWPLAIIWCLLGPAVSPPSAPADRAPGRSASRSQRCVPGRQ